MVELKYVRPDYPDLTCVERPVAGAANAIIIFGVRVETCPLVRRMASLRRGYLNLPSNLSTRKITRSTIRWVNTIIGVDVHVSVAIAHGFNQISQISPLTPIVGVGSCYGSSDRSYIHRSLPRDHRIKERGPNSAIFPCRSTVNVGCNYIFDVNQVEREV
jgi:hypothetical protein